jgi:hypothetical protein
MSFCSTLKHKTDPVFLVFAEVVLELPRLGVDEGLALAVGGVVRVVVVLVVVIRRRRRPRIPRP